jgi:hypothetical protein
VGEKNFTGMADEKKIVIEIRGGATSATSGGTTGAGGSTSSNALDLEVAKQKTAQLKEEEKRRTLDHKAELAKRLAEEKRATQAAVKEVKDANKQKLAEDRKAAQTQHTPGNPARPPCVDKRQVARLHQGKGEEQHKPGRRAFPLAQKAVMEGRSVHA